MVEITEKGIPLTFQTVYLAGADTGFWKGGRGSGYLLTTKMRCICVHARNVFLKVWMSPKIGVGWFPDLQARPPRHPPPPLDPPLFGKEIKYF